MNYHGNVGIKNIPMLMEEEGLEKEITQYIIFMVKWTELTTNISCLPKQLQSQESLKKVLQNFYDCEKQFYL